MLCLAAAPHAYLIDYKPGYAKYKKLYPMKIYRFDFYPRKNLIRR
jgi:hypothetical protein